ncbi:MAG TPA: hypothetical protein VEH30_14720, partial [Terriglobales bacterium]|nr:hypothetical protein [Terriglobales bacterium]
KPFFGKSSCHVEPPTGLELVVRRSSGYCAFDTGLNRAFLPLHTCSTICDHLSKCINTYR